jgi:hypothetical protein
VACRLTDQPSRRRGAAVTRAESKPQFNPAAIISFVKDAAILVGIAATASVYVASAHVGTDLALLNYKISQLSRQSETSSGGKPESNGANRILSPDSRQTAS